VSGEVVLEVQAHDGREVSCLDVYTDGTRMASGGGDGTVRVWDTWTGKCLQVLRGHRYRMNNLVCVRERERECVCVGGRCMRARLRPTTTPLLTGGGVDQLLTCRY
jgi:WD40 repeat protein